MHIGIYDSTFRPFHESFCKGQRLPEGFEYVDNQWQDVDAIMATPGHLSEAMLYPHKRKIALLGESPLLIPPISVIQARNYDLVLTNNADWLGWPNARWFMPLGTWLEQRPVEPIVKSRDISMTASDKQQLPGQRLRLEFAEIITSQHLPIDGYGRAFGRPLADKAESLLPYRFHIAIENVKARWYNSEKLFDAFAARCVPVYWGNTERLDELGFNVGGILNLHEGLTPQENLAEILAKCTPELYNAMLPAVEHNFQRIWQTPAPEYWMRQIITDYFGLTEDSPNVI